MYINSNGDIFTLEALEEQAIQFFKHIDPCGEFVRMPVDWLARIIKVYKLTPLH